MSMKINVMKSCDKALNVTSKFVAIERVSGEVDILPLIHQQSEFGQTKKCLNYRLQ